MSDITVCIATIPPRRTLLARALASVTQQTLLPDHILVEYDHEHTGCIATKNRLLKRVTTRYVAFLDDDDAYYPEHLSLLHDRLYRSVASVAFSIPGTPHFLNGMSPFWPRYDTGEAVETITDEMLRERPFVQTCGMLHRTDALYAVGGWQSPSVPGYELLDDWGVMRAYVKCGHPFVYLPRVTYEWSIRTVGSPGVEGNTSGDPTRWA